MKQRLALSFLIALTLFNAIKTPADVQAEAHVRTRVVKLTSDRGSCSGIQVRSPRGIDYILTASHCNVLARDGAILAQLDGGRPIPRKIIEDANFSDLLLLEGMPNLEGIQIASHVSPKQHLMAITHGLGLATHRADGEAVENQEIAAALFKAESDEEKQACISKPKQKLFEGFFGSVCALVVTELITTVHVDPGSSGGPVVDLDGRLVGIVSVGSESISGLTLLQDIQMLMSAY